MKLPGFVGLLSPQLWLAIILAAVLALGAAGAAGVRFGKQIQAGKDAKEIAAAKAETVKAAALVEKKNEGLRRAADRFHQFAGIFEQFNTEAARWKAESDAAEQRAREAAGAAAEAERRLQRNEAERIAAERRARQRPGCAALLDLDVETELRKCGLR